jgi:ferredoxin
MLNEVKHLVIAREILRCAQNDIVHHFTCDKAGVCCSCSVSVLVDS